MEIQKNKFDEMWDKYKEDPSPNQSFLSFLWWEQYKHDIKLSLNNK
jgi:hypothetical protein